MGKEKLTRKIVAMAPYERGWSNVELIKDCGLIPYLLHKNYGYDVTLVGANSDTYNYLDLVKGIKMDFLPSGREEDKLYYIEKNASQIDCLLIRGCYPSNFNVVKLYRQLNPTGRIYVGLDANSIWMDKIVWDEKEFVEFMDCCDVIATSCRKMQDHLNLKWPWKIEYIPNGYYDFSQQNTIPSFQNKENIILSVGRLEFEEKATNILMEAFAMAAQYIPDWKLRLVGKASETFEIYIQKYFTVFPQLKNRIELVGVISERNQLKQEYYRAKIFALSSNKEGGPNVIAEALNAGCATAVTKIDACEEAIAYGRCGLAAEINDISGFAQNLLSLCSNPELEKLSVAAYEYGFKYLNMEKIVAKLNELLFGGRDDEYNYTGE